MITIYTTGTEEAIHWAAEDAEGNLLENDSLEIQGDHPTVGSILAIIKACQWLVESELSTLQCKILTDDQGTIDTIYPVLTRPRSGDIDHAYSDLIKSLAGVAAIIPRQVSDCMPAIRCHYDGCGGRFVGFTPTGDPVCAAHEEHLDDAGREPLERATAAA